MTIGSSRIEWRNLVTSADVQENEDGISSGPTRRSLLRSAAAGALAFPFANQALAAPPAGGLRFLAVGDWGMPGSQAARDVAAAMAEAARLRQTSFVISTGDNFYPAGVEGVGDPKWRAVFEDVYRDVAPTRPWYPVLGNHDHRGDVEAQITYSEKSRRWRMPGRYFALTERFGGGSLDIFFLDIDPIAATGWIGPWRGTDTSSEHQIRWLDRRLASSRAPWKIVVGHHPVFSRGWHGDTPELVRRVKPVLERHRVAIYLNGHDHSLQHVERGGIAYLTCGAGAEARWTGKTEGTLFAAATTGFLVFDIDFRRLAFTFVDASGRILHRARVTRKT